MRKKIFVLFILFLGIPFMTIGATNLSGKILLQVEENGEAWYVNPLNNLRYYLGRPDDAFNLMRRFGLGITTENLNKIPIGLIAQSGTDSDNDGLVDLLEDAIGTNKYNKDTDDDSFNDKQELINGYNPNGPGKFPDKIDYQLIERLKGRILLQVESRGEAWYVNPDNGQRYFLGRPIHAFEIMRNLGLGITNNDLSNLQIGQ